MRFLIERCKYAYICLLPKTEVFIIRVTNMDGQKREKRDQINTEYT